MNILGLRKVGGSRDERQCVEREIRGYVHDYRGKAAEAVGQARRSEKASEKAIVTTEGAIEHLRNSRRMDDENFHELVRLMRGERREHG